MNVHEAANIFPLDEATIPELAEDIRKNGLINPIELVGGAIIDGRRRLRACEMAGVKPRFKDVSPDDPIAYAWSLNGPRRNLSVAQKALCGARMRELYDKQAKERQKEGQERGRKKQKGIQENLPETNSSAGQARDAVGKAVGVSGKSIDAATKVLKQGTPALVAAVDADHLAVSTAARASSLSSEEQNALASRAAEEAARGRRRPRHTEAEEAADEEPHANGKLKGVGVIRANEAINCLTRIPRNDALRKRGFQLVKDWIRRNP